MGEQKQRKTHSFQSPLFLTFPKQTTITYNMTNYNTLTGAADLPSLLAAPWVPISEQKWSQLWQWDDSFKWEYGVTPFSHLKWIVGFWVFYATMIISFKYFIMPGRKSWKFLDPAIKFYNLAMSAISFWMLVGTIRSTYRDYAAHNFDPRAAYCCADPLSSDCNGERTYWMYIYFVTKFPELLDTFFLLVKHKPLIFLHVYHHAIVLFMMWTWNQSHMLIGNIGMSLNCAAHTFMYFYYWASLSGIKLPKWCRSGITKVQIVQFLISFVLSYYRFGYEMDSEGVCLGWWAYVTSTLINISFFSLFVKFYLETYVFGKKKSDKKANVEAEKKPLSKEEERAELRKAALQKLD